MLRHPDRGSYSVAQEWTDWGVPDACSGTPETMHKLAVEPLLELADLISELRERPREDLDE